MTAASNYLEPKILDHVLGKAARNFTSPANLYVALFLGSAGPNLEDGSTTSNEVSDANYTRQSITFGAATSAGAANTNAITFSAAAANIGEITNMAIMDASTGGNVLFYGAITNPKTIFQDDSFSIPIGSIVVQIA